MMVYFNSALTQRFVNVLIVSHGPRMKWAERFHLLWFQEQEI